MRRQSLQDLDTLRQSVEKHVSHLDGAQQSQQAQEHEALLSKMQAELQDATRSQKAIEEEAADLRVRLASAEERSKMLQLRQDEIRKERAHFDEERKTLSQQTEQQWQKLTSVEGDTQRFKAEAEAHRTEVARLNAARLEEAEQMRAEREAWRAEETRFQNELSQMQRKLDETERKDACAQLRLQIERLEVEAGTQAEQLNTAK